MPFGLWTRVGRRKHKFSCIRQVAPMCPHGRHIGATWRIHLNRPYVVAMQPYVKLLWPLVIAVLSFSYAYILEGVTEWESLYLHCVSQKASHLWLAIIFTYRDLIATIVGKNVAEKVGNQNVLYFPTSPNCCFCTTRGNRKPRNCIFSLKCCMLFYQKNTKHSLKYHLVRAEQPFAVKMIDWVHQTGSCCLLSTCCVLTKSVMVSFAV